MRIVIALGGNALGDKPEVQKENAKITASYLKKIIDLGHEVVITHGNGPQVGLVNLAFTEGGKVNEKVFEMPFPECGSMTQGYIGYHLQNALVNEGVTKPVCSIITQVLVDKCDEAFKNPTKPIGSFYTKEEALKMPYPTTSDSGRGYRRVVASPKPIGIVEEHTIESLLSLGNVVIACGGGGIPVIKDGNTYKGVDAVIDKDYVSAFLADKINADMLLILTAVDYASINYGKENQENLGLVTRKEIAKYNEDGHFAKGSMKPKVEACLNFLNGKNNRIAVITSITGALDAIEGKCGTRIKD